MRKKSGRLSTIILIIILLVGLSVMLYPIISNWWNERVQSKVISDYKETVSKMDSGNIEKLINEAHEYNEQIVGLYAPFINYDEIPGYDDILNVSGTGIMGYITIPVIHAEYPIYHGTIIIKLRMFDYTPRNFFDIKSTRQSICYIPVH